MNIRYIKCLSCLALFVINLVIFPPIISAGDDDDDDGGSSEEKSTGINVSLPITGAVALDIKHADVDLDMPGSSGIQDFNNGYIEASANKPTLSVYSNTSWQLKVKVISDWNVVNSYQKATADLQLKVHSPSGPLTGFSSYASLSLSDQEIASDSDYADKEQYKCRYKVLLDWGKDVPGIYTITVLYTMATTN